MKNVFFGFCFLIVFSTVVLSQSWQESAGHGHRNVHEYTVITKDQFDRLRRQYESRFDWATFSYVDALESRPNVINGTRPRFNGYYYLLGTKFSIVEETRFLVYGNSNTGRMYIEFPAYMTDLLRHVNDNMNMAGGIRIGSNEYINHYNRHIRWVNGE